MEPPNRTIAASAAAAALLLPLALGGEDVHILPAGECDLSLPGTLVLMKPGRDLRAFKAALNASGRDAWPPWNPPGIGCIR